MKYLICTVLIILGFQTSAQIINPKETAKRKTNDRVNSGVDRTIDKGLDKIEEGIGSIFKKKEKAPKESAQKKDTKDSKSSEAAEKGDSKVGDDKKSGVEMAPEDKTDFKKFRDFDFVPGEKTLFFEDFVNTRTGQGAGNWTVIEWDKGETDSYALTTINGKPGRWFKAPKRGVFFPNSFNDLPEEFTMEFDMYYDESTMSEMMGGLVATFVSRKQKRDEYDIHFNPSPEIRLDIHPVGEPESITYLHTMKEYDGNETQEERVLFSDILKKIWKSNEVAHISISRKGKAIKLYIDENKYIDLPEGLPKKQDYGLLFSTNMWGEGLYITNIRIGTGNSNTAPAIKNEIKTAKKFVSTSIYFDVNSARIKPESWATLKEIAEAIQSLEGKIQIVGHTDSDGNDATNLSLSVKRAASVKHTLVTEFGIEAKKLTTDGKGETMPVASNTTLTGKAQNRRVEFTEIK